MTALLERALREHDADLITVVDTAAAADANLLPLDHEPVGAKRQGRDFKPLLESGLMQASSDFSLLMLTVATFRDEIVAAGIAPGDVLFAFAGDPDRDPSFGLWVTDYQPTSAEDANNAVFTRIA